MKKVLFCATVDRHIVLFHIPFLKYFKDEGFEVHVVSNGNNKIPYVDKKMMVQFERSPFKFFNIKAYFQLKQIIDSNGYEIMHFHTPIAGVLGRLAARHTRKRGVKIIYTAHGFHFYKGAPILNWLLYYPIEKWLARYTDCLITINDEDYKLVVNKRFKAKRIEKTHGVGVDLVKFHPIVEEVKNAIRKKNGYSSEDFILIYPAELNKNKNQQLLIHVISNLRNNIPNIKLLLPGEDSLNGYYQRLAEKLNVSDLISFLGMREDVDELIGMSDVSVASSMREGLPRNIMESMACGKPVVASNNRGHRSLIKEGRNGFLCNPGDKDKFCDCILRLYNDKQLYTIISKNNIEDIKPFSVDNVEVEMAQIYKTFIKDNSL